MSTAQPGPAPDPSIERQARFTDALTQIDRLLPGPSFDLDAFSFTGSAGFTSAFDVDTLAFASAAAAVMAGGGTTVSTDRVVSSFVGPVAVDGQSLPKWASLSGYYRTRDDRFLQFHANFPHHSAGIVERLGCSPEREAVQEAVLDWDPLELEETLIADGMIAARLRTLDEWAEHPHAMATADLPLVSVERIGDAAPRSADRGLRVADCSRVLAGPVAGQTLAAQGADVLRIGAEHLPSVEVCVISTGAGKRNAVADLRSKEGKRAFAAVLEEADVWLDAYRPGAMTNHGFTPEGCAPGTVIVQLCAFDWVGPWAGRRGFDSIVQSTTGVVEGGRGAAGAEGPTPLPVQALDYATGYLAAAAARRVCAHQAEVGGTWLVRLSLLRTRNWLVGLQPPAPFEPATPAVDEDTLTTMASDFGEVSVPRPLVGDTWPSAPAPLATSPLRWLPR